MAVASRPSSSLQALGLLCRPCLLLLKRPLQALERGASLLSLAYQREPLGTQLLERGAVAIGCRAQLLLLDPELLVLGAQRRERGVAALAQVLGAPGGLGALRQLAGHLLGRGDRPLQLSLARNQLLARGRQSMLGLRQLAFARRGPQRLVHPQPLQVQGLVGEQLGRAEPAQRFLERAVVGQHALVGKHAKPVRPVQDTGAELAIGLREEVLDGGADPVARPTLVEGVGELRVEPARLAQLVRAGDHAAAGIRLAIGGGDLVGLVVEVAPTVRPVDVVQERQREAAVSARAGEQAQLVEDRVPVVVAVQQHDVGIRDPIQRHQAALLVVDERHAVVATQLADVQLRPRVDRVHDRAVLDGVGQQPARRGSLADPHLDDRARPRCFEQRPDRELPVADHERVSRYSARPSLARPR